LIEKAALANYTSTAEKRWPRSSRSYAQQRNSGHATAAAPPPMQRHFRSIQRVSDPRAGLLASHLDIVALRIANKSVVKELQTNQS
jgi:hypothetical protein